VALSLNETVVSLFIIIFGLLSMIFTTGLFVYHTNLIKNNLTTKEELKNIYGPPQGNPHKRSLLKNIISAFCSPIPKISLLEQMRIKMYKVKKDRTKTVIFLINYILVS
jgi:hypothetical protein